MCYGSKWAIAILALLNLLLLSSCDDEVVTKKDFSVVDDMTLNGSASVSGGVLSLTNDYWQTGSAFLTNPIALSALASFSAEFSFRIDNPRGAGGGADGLCFVLQTASNSAGGLGGGLGYEGLRPSMAIEFDTYNNGEVNDNHIGINLNGSTRSISNVRYANRIDSGTPWTVWVDYNGKTQTLDVRIASTGSRPEVAVLSNTIDLAAIFEGRPVYFGFTSGTGAGAGDHKILSWNLSSAYIENHTDKKTDYHLSISGPGALIDGVTTLAIGEQFTVDVVVTGSFVGRQFDIDLTMGGYQIKVPVHYIDELTGQKTLASPTDLAGPHYYQSAPIQLGFDQDNPPSKGLKVEVAGEEVIANISGLTQLTAIEIIDSHSSKVQASINLVDSIRELERLTAFLVTLDAAELFEYAASSLIAVAQSSANPEIVELYALQLLGLSDMALNVQLDHQLAITVNDMIDDGWWDHDHLDAPVVKKALALIKRVAIADILHRLSDLNQWKIGSGVIESGTYLTHTPAEAIAKLGKMDDRSDAEEFSKTNGIAKSAEIVGQRFDQIAHHAKAKGHKLALIWDAMNKSRERFREAEAQFDIVFDWSSSRAKHAKQYLRSESGYKELLGRYQILSVIIEDKEGDEAPLWQAILGATTKDQEHRYVLQAVGVAEEQLRLMLGNLIEMRDVDDLIELASPRYSNLHAKASALNAPVAKDLVDLAKAQYESVKGERAVYGALTDLGVWVGYGVGIFVPPFAYAAAAVEVGHSGTDAILAYQDSSSADAAADVGFGSVLEADKAGIHYTNALGYLGLDAMFSIADLKMLRQLRKARHLSRKLNFDSVKALQTKKGIKKIAAQDAEFFAQIHRLETLAENQLKWSKVNAEKLKVAKREIRKLKGPENKAARAELRKERDRLKQLSEDQLRHHRNNLNNVRQLRNQRMYSGRHIDLPRNYKALEGTYVEGLIHKKLARVFDLKALGKQNSAFYAQMYDLGKGHYMFGPKVHPIEMIDVKAGGRITKKPRLRYEIKNKGYIKNTDGSYVKPPKEVEVLKNGKMQEVKTGYNDASQKMQYDRIVLDNKEGVAYVEDIVRTANEKHFAKTTAYAHSLDKALPNHKAINIPMKNGKSWPRDIHYTEMKNLVVNLNPDLGKFPLLKGKKTQ